MPGLPTFTDFMLATKVHKITSAREILNDAVENTYLIGEMLRGKENAQVVRTGSRIKDSVRLNEAGSFEFYQPNATFSPQDRDTLTDVSLDWRFAKTDFGYNDETITLNEGNPEDIYVNLKQKYKGDASTDMMNGMERALWAVPNATTMEAGSGDDPPAFSVSAFINEDATTGHWTGFTTVMGVNPATETRWDNQRSTYNAANPSDDETGVLAAFDEMFLDVLFESPDSTSEYFENDRLRAMKIVTNRDGHKLYKRLLRGGNDVFQSPQDPQYNNPRYAGIPVKYISTLNTALLDQANGTAWASGEPRFIWMNLMFLFPIFHTRGYLEQVGPVPGGITQPFSHAVYFRVWYNIFCRSRQRQGIISPAA